jgi:thiazole synthase
MTAQINLTVNGEPRRSAAATIAELVGELGLKPEKVAVERNGTIVPRSTLGEVALTNGDVLEIVHFVGGGSAHCREAAAGAADPSPSAPDGAPSSPARGEDR